MKLVVGLGNPGRFYAHHRHNIGFMCLRHFARIHGIKLDKKRGQARTGTGQADGITLMAARPQTYMNHSGEAIAPLVNRLQISLDDLVVIHDDLDLPAGKIRIRQGSGSGGHNGIESIISRLGSPDFIRVRVGIGRPPLSEAADREAAVINYVLSDFTAEGKKIMSGVIPEVSRAIVYLLTRGLTAAMNEYN